MENFDFGKAINIFLIAFVIFIVVMIAFVARLVSTFMVRNKNTNLTKSYAQTIPPAESAVEIAHNTTVSLTRISENYISTQGQVKEQTYEVLLTIAQARKQALNELFESDPGTIDSVIFPDDVRSLLPEEAKTLIEKKVIIEGRFSVTEVSGNSDKHYVLISRNGEEYSLYFADGMPQVAPNTGVRINGILLDNKIAVQSIEQITL